VKFGKKQILPVLILLLLFSIGTTTGTVIAKYVTERELTEQITFTAELAEKMVLEEYEAERTSGGDYSLDSTTPKNANSYELMPGVDIVKKPYIQISEKTPIKAYLFLEIVGHQPGEETNGVRYALTDAWVKADTVQGKHEGTVYVYSSGENPVELDETLTEINGFKNIDIIKGGKVYVSQELNKSADKFTVTFYAVMTEAVEGKSLAQTYNDAVTLPQNTQ